MPPLPRNPRRAPQAQQTEDHAKAGLDSMETLINQEHAEAIESLKSGNATHPPWQQCRCCNVSSQDSCIRKLNLGHGASHAERIVLLNPGCRPQGNILNSEWHCVLNPD